MKIQSKLFFILFGFSIVIISTLVLLMQWSIGKGMIEYVNTKDLEALRPLQVVLANEYKTDNSWSAISGKNGKFKHLVLQQLGESDSQPRKPPRGKEEFNRPPPRKGDLFNDEARPNKKRQPPPTHDIDYALLDDKGSLIVGRYDDPSKFNRSPIMIDDSIIGYLAVSKRNRLTEGYELDFIEKQQSYLWIIALTATAMVLLMTLIITRHIVVPVKLIASGIHKLTQGNYQQSIKLNRKDELGDLNRDCNELALTLSENENARKRWLADTSHELRTPVAILSGELEAMYHGIRPLDKKNIQSAMEEVAHLKRLINDLHQLNSADVGGMQYRKKALDIVNLLENEQSKYDTYLAGKNISLALKLPNHEVMVYLDVTRFFQLIGNILENITKYAQANKVQITLTTAQIENTENAVIYIEDNGIGVDKENLPKLFEFLYRVEDSRNRETGGSGLGLSICQRIVNAHQGTIRAEKSSLGGLAIVIELPIL